jgi:hypothetical protein
MFALNADLFVKQGLSMIFIFQIRMQGFALRHGCEGTRSGRYLGTG